MVKLTGDQDGVPNVGIVITDGRSQNMEQTWKEAVSNRRENIHMLAIGVGGSIRYEELRMIASAPAESNVWTVASFNDLNEDLVYKIRDAVCDGIATVQNL